MARPLSHRVARLERASPSACPRCGAGGPGPVFEVVVPEAAARVAHGAASPDPERCPACGRPTEYSITLPAARERWADEITPSQRRGGHQ